MAGSSSRTGKIAMLSCTLYEADAVRLTNDPEPVLSALTCLRLATRENHIDLRPDKFGNDLHEALVTALPQR
jgi:hypothetical protein